MTARAGRIGCVCDALAPDEGRELPAPGTARLAMGFALGVTAQALVLGILPLAGWQSALAHLPAGLPLAALLLGGVVSTFPAALLLDRFGRRAAFALGASLGAAGGLLLAFAILERNFHLLLLGAFWFGLAQGFGVFYRHAASRRTAAPSLVLAAGAAAGFVAPALAATAETIGAPYLLVGTAAAAALVQIATLAVAAGMREPQVCPMERTAHEPSAFLPALAIGAAAWFGMAASMQAAPLALAGCGVSVGGISGAVAWHLVAMYAPAALMPRLARAMSWKAAGLGALGLMAAAWLVIGQAGSATMIALAFGAVGASWGVAFAAATAGLHRAAPRPVTLAAFDAALFAAAFLGAALA